MQRFEIPPPRLRSLANSDSEMRHAIAHQISGCRWRSGFASIVPSAKWSPRRRKRSRKSPPIAGSLAVSGKSSESKDCVVFSAAAQGTQPGSRRSTQLSERNEAERGRSRWPDRFASGKRNSLAQRQTAQNRRQVSAETRELRGPWPSPGNPQVRRTAWWARQECRTRYQTVMSPWINDLGLRSIPRGSVILPGSMPARRGNRAPGAAMAVKVLPICSLRRRLLAYGQITY